MAESSNERKRHGAIVVKNGNIVGMGFNRFRNDPDRVSPEHVKTDCSYHAEIVALRMAGDNANGATLYVARVNNVVKISSTSMQGISSVNIELKWGTDIDVAVDGVNRGAGVLGQDYGTAIDG